MIGKISHGNSFGDCLDYLTRVKQDKQPSEKRVWHIIDSDGVRLNVGEEGWRKMAVTDVERPTLTRSKIKDPCGHISLGFSPKDSDRMTDDFMLKIAHEYMEKMGITDTPYIIVRIRIRNTHTVISCSVVSITTAKSSNLSPTYIATKRSAPISPSSII